MNDDDDDDAAAEDDDDAATEDDDAELNSVYVSDNDMKPHSLMISMLSHMPIITIAAGSSVQH